MTIDDERIRIQGLLIPEDQPTLDGMPTARLATVQRDALAAALKTRLSRMSLDEIVGIITNEYSEIINYLALAGETKTCTKTSLLFNPHRLDTRTMSSKMSIYEAIMEHESFHSGLARATLVRMREGSFNQLFYMTIQLGINGVQYVNEFPPHVARDFCRQYMLSTEAHILDPCAGWGGRMIGCSVVAANYCGYEPATQTAHGLRRLAKFIRSMRTDFRARIHCQPYEDSDELPNFYDFALTSPPYYDSEIYSDEPTNSLNRYHSFDEWCDNFYLPLIDKTMRQLKPGAVFVINIGDRRWPLTTRLLKHCGAMGYACRQIRGELVNNQGFGKTSGEGEKFFEIRTKLT